MLAIVDEEPAHGFAIASLTAAGAALGRVWQTPRPVVYRAIGRLEELGLVVPVGEQPGRGPLRQMFAATDEGTAEVGRWLVTPALHVRDVRSQLLMKLALLDRRGVDPAELLERQRALLETDRRGPHGATPRHRFRRHPRRLAPFHGERHLAFLDAITPDSPALGPGTGVFHTERHGLPSGRYGVRSVRSPEAETRAVVRASAQAELTGGQSDPGLRIGLDHGRGRAAGVPDAGDHLHGGVRRDADLDRVARRAVLEHGEEVLGEQPEVCAVGRLGTHPGQSRGHLRGVGQPEPGRHQGSAGWSGKGWTIWKTW